MKNTVAFWACLGISQVWFASDGKGREWNGWFWFALAIVAFVTDWIAA